MYDYFLTLKYFGIFVLMMVFPLESVMPLAGHLAAVGDISLPGAIVCGTAGSTLGSTIIYMISRLVGQEVLTTFIVKYGKWLGVTVKSTEKAGRWFDQHARATVYFGRFVPGVRTAVSVPAGIRRMPLGAFLLYTVLGSGTWVTCITLIGYYAWTGYLHIEKTANYMALGIETALLIVLLIAVIVHYRRHR